MIEPKGIRRGSMLLAGLLFLQSAGMAAYLQPGLWTNLSRIDGHYSNPAKGGLDTFFAEPSAHIEDEIDRIELPLPMPEGGPDQPEVQSFSPIGVSDMVDPFSGDFSYNIPLLEVDGYPINIAYNAGITMDQEASWVGLGWNLNPGVINRAMRGLPDDFNGTDQIVKERNVRANNTYSLNAGMNFELFGFDDLGAGVNLNLLYNNYNGFSSTIGFSVATDITGLNAGLGISGSSQGGATLTPSVSIQNDKQHNKVQNKISVAAPINSRAGLSNMSVSYTRTLHRKNEAGKFNVSASKGTSSSFNFATPTYVPNFDLPFASGGLTFSVKLGGDALGSDLSGAIGGSFSTRFLTKKQVSQPAYGYLNLHSGQSRLNALLDFNRENDGAFTKNTPALPIPVLTYDIYSVSGQGVNGSYRPMRNEIGHVFDPISNSVSVDASVGFEVGAGATFKGGVDIAVGFVSSNSGKWGAIRGNPASSNFTFKRSLVEFREANELSVLTDEDHFERIGGERAVRMKLKNHNRLENYLEYQNGTPVSPNQHTKQGSDRRNQVMHTLSVGDVKNGFGIRPFPSNSFAQQNSSVNHHIGEFTVLNTEGTRYVYGLPAFSHFQEDVSFAINNPGNSLDCTNGLVPYAPGIDNSLSNKNGIDYHFNRTRTPAYAHSYLLTTVLNADYVDADHIPGPSKGDLGGYLLISYKQVNDYRWRNPSELNKASYDEGMHTNKTDDKAHYIYGQKELWYVDTIISKNHVAIFYTSNRLDALSVTDGNGGLNTNGARMQKLDSIQLFAIPDLESNPNTKPIKTVHFVYNYELCPGYSGHINGTGKLTLKEVYFTYEGSHKGRKTPYKFEYGTNKAYNLKAQDRWNTYKEAPTCQGNNVETDPLRPVDFPYTGLNKAQADEYAGAWNLNRIHLPSGGRIEVDYESDDYAYVQHLRATQMFKIVGVESQNGNSAPMFQGVRTISGESEKNPAIYVELQPDGNGGYLTNVSEYVKVGEQIYFKALISTTAGNYDFAPGFGIVESALIEYHTISGVSKPLLKIKLKGVSMTDSGSASYNPISLAGIQLSRLHLSKFIPPSSQNSVSTDVTVLDFVMSIVGSATVLLEFFTGPNLPLWYQNVGRDIVTEKSWVRLQNPGYNKLGGGHRVKEIRIYDAWDEMTSNQQQGYHYGQRYEYSDEKGRSTGVASYEPQVGGDENVFRQPVHFSNKVILAPDDRNYQMTPYGEQFFPSPRVGYSMVTVRDLPRPGVTRTATGKVVHEFYTARDYPTIVSRTTADIKRFKLPIYAVFMNLIDDNLAATQGFVVQTNDMHGKPKSQRVYAEGQTELISQVHYYYLDEPITLQGVPARKLRNQVTSVAKDGSLVNSTIGLHYDAVADFRFSKTNNISTSLGINLNFTTPFILVPMIFGTLDKETTTFKGASFSKVIERVGLLHRTEATDLGSKVETRNLAYDAETGEVILTQTNTNFNDTIYSLTYPAHWHYDLMGQAYRNVGKRYPGVTLVNGGTSIYNSTQFAAGDEVGLRIGSTFEKAWVTDANHTGIRIMRKNGTPVNGAINEIVILRSGRRNMQSTPIGTLITKRNPLTTFQGNIFQEVLQAGAVEFNDEWRTFCECFLDVSDVNRFTTNPYVLGTKGTWRPVASYVHLTGRTQTDNAGNSNVRRDGVFTSYKPYYKLVNGKWVIDRTDWTYTSSVVEFSPFGQALETVDALKRFSSSMYGYNQTLPVAVAANTRYRQLGYDGFEDYDFDNCSDNHFRLATGGEITETEAHTGRRSLKVSSGNPVVFANILVDDCIDHTVGNYGDCAFSIDTTFQNIPDKKLIIFSSPNASSLQIDYDLISGLPSVSLGLNSISFEVPNSNLFFIVTIYFTDENGCTQIITYTNTVK